MKQLIAEIYKYGNRVNGVTGNEVVDLEQLEYYIKDYISLWDISIRIAELTNKISSVTNEDILNSSEKFREVTREVFTFSRQLEELADDSKELMLSIVQNFIREDTLNRYKQIFSLDLSEFKHYVERLNKYSPFLEEFHEYRYFSYEYFDQYEADCLRFVEYLEEYELTEEAKELVIEIIDALEYVLEDFTSHLLGRSWNPIKNYSEVQEVESETKIMVSDRIRILTEKLLRASIVV